MGHPDFSEYSFYEVGRTDPFSVESFVVFLEALLELDHRSPMHEEGNLLLEGSQGYAKATGARQFVGAQLRVQDFAAYLSGVGSHLLDVSPIAP
jgi:hypothetical protein